MRKIKEIFTNKDTLFNLFIALTLVGLHTWQYIKSEYEIKALINLIMAGSFVLLTFIINTNILAYFLLAYSFIWIPFESFDGYSSLLLLLSAISLNRKLWVCFLPYCIEVFVCYMFKGMEISHIGITACYLIFFWKLYVKIQAEHREVKPLVLTEDEELILQELCSGKEVKELDMSEKTAYNKLRDARERNNCLSNKELKKQYKSFSVSTSSNLQ